MARKSTKRPVLKQETGEKYPAAVVGTGAAARTAGGADADAHIHNSEPTTHYVSSRMPSTA